MAAEATTPTTVGDADESDRERLKSALWFSVAQIVDEESLRRDLNATPQFIGALTELTWTQLVANTPSVDTYAESVATDLEAFAHHASRTAVAASDVLLLARKNPDLLRLMRDFVDHRRPTAAAVSQPPHRQHPGPEARPNRRRPRPNTSARDS